MEQKKEQKEYFNATGHILIYYVEFTSIWSNKKVKVLYSFSKEKILEYIKDNEHEWDDYYRTNIEFGVVRKKFRKDSLLENYRNYGEIKIESMNVAEDKIGSYTRSSIFIK